MGQLANDVCPKWSWAITHIQLRNASVPATTSCCTPKRTGPVAARPRWKFVLQSVGGDEQLSAADAEPNIRRSRLELLAVVRGLEALDRPSRVTLLTGSRYVSRGIRRQLNQWRERQLAMGAIRQAGADSRPRPVATR